MMNILITGGLGFIGHLVSKKLIDQGHNVYIIDSQTSYGVIPQDEINYLMTERKKLVNTENIFDFDICDEYSMNGFFKNAEYFDIVIHMASFPRQDIVNSNPVYGSKVMINGLLNLIELCKHRTNRFVYVSSSMVYGDFKSNIRETATCSPIGKYAIMKLTGEHLVADYSKQGHFDYVVVRPSAVYGPLDVKDRVVSKFFDAAINDDIITVKGATQTLDFTYVDDAAEGIVLAALKGKHGNIYNITRGVGVKLINAAKLIHTIVGKGKIIKTARDYNFPKRGKLCIDKAIKDLNYNPQIDIEQGFIKYYDWLQNTTFWSKKTI